MREDTGLSVREFAQRAKFPSHTTYAYYESSDFTGDEIRKAPRVRIAAALLALGIDRERVAELGRLPDGADQPSTTLAELVEQVAELRDAVLGRRRSG
jgi:transcriptional regulator with XRE-family HTH domain